MKALFFRAVIEYNVKTSGHRNDQLLKLLVCMPTTIGAARHIVEVIDPLDCEWDVSIPFNKCEVSSRVTNLGQQY